MYTIPNQRIYSLPEAKKLLIPEWMSSPVVLGDERERRERIVYKTELNYTHSG